MVRRVFALVFLFKLALGEKYHSVTHSNDDLSTLKFVNVIFRHGNRTADKSELYPLDPYLNYDYYPFGTGQLTNVGKRVEYAIGNSLRTRYSNLLGPYYTPDLIDTKSTDVNRTKMSLELVLAGLFPPTGEELWFKDENGVKQEFWQPVPYNYLPVELDHVLEGTKCPKYKRLYERHTKCKRVQKEYEQYRKVFDYIANNTGIRVENFFDVYNLYFGLTTENEYGLKLPAWTDSVFPQTITDLAIKQYFIYSGTQQMQKFTSGYLLQEIRNNAIKKANGETPNKKMMLYSAHENNIAAMLIALQVFKPHVPNYGSHIIIELHKSPTSDYSFRVLYQNYDKEGLHVLQLPFCGQFCDLQQFSLLLEPYLPQDNFCGDDKQG